MDSEDELRNTLRRIESSASVNTELEHKQDLSICFIVENQIIYFYILTYLKSAIY